MSGMSLLPTLCLFRLGPLLDFGMILGLEILLSRSTFIGFTTYLVSQGALVRDFWSSAGWTFSWRHPIRGGVKGLQFENLMDLLTPVVMTSILGK